MLFQGQTEKSQLYNQIQWHFYGFLGIYLHEDIVYNASYIYPLSSKSQPFQCKIRQINRIVSF